MATPTPLLLNLDRSLVRGIAWTGGVKWLTQLVSWGATLIIARLLTPQDYGLVGMAMVYLGLAQIVSEGGLSGAIIQRRELNEDQIARLGGLSVCLGAALCLISNAVAGLIADFFGQPGVRNVLVVLSLTFLTRSLLVVPRSLLARDLEFRKVAWIDGIEALTLTVGVLALALFGLGAWALVIGTVAAGGVVAALALHWRPHRIAVPWPFDQIAGAAMFGWHLVLAQIAWYVYSNADFAVVGRELGRSALGAYAFAWTIASIPVERVSGLVGRVTPAFFAAMQHDRAELRRYLQRLTEGLAVLTLPVCLGLALVADDFVLVVLGETWRPAIAPLRLLAVYAALRSVVSLVPQILVATGHVKRSMHFSVVAALVLPPLFHLGSAWGTTGVALGWVVGYPLVALAYMRSTFAIIGLPASAYLRALWPAASGCIALALAVLAARLALPAGQPGVVRLVTEVLTGALGFATLMFLVHGRRLRAFLGVLRQSGLSLVTAPTPMYVVRRTGSPAASGRRRLLLISYHFPPGQATGALRWQKLARFAADWDWELDVVTLDAASLTTPPPDPRRLAELPPGTRVFGIRRPALLLERLNRVLSRWLHRSSVAPRLTRAPQPDSLGRRELGERSGAPRDLVRAYFAWLEYAGEGRWARRAARAALHLVETGVHQAVVTCGPPHMAHEAGRLVARATGLPLVMDLRDPWSLIQRLPEAIASQVWLALAARYERRAVAQAALVVANTEPLRRAMQAAYPARARRIIAVTNGCDAEPVAQPAAGQEPARRFTLVYAGSIYLDRDPRPLFRAAARLVHEAKLTPADFGLELMGSVWQYEGKGVDVIACDEGLDHYLRLHPQRPRQEALRFLSRATMLVTLAQDSDMAIPAKLFDYMLFDAWILALARPDSAIELLLRDSGADVVPAEDTDGILAVLRRRYAQHLAGERATRLAGIARYSRREQARILFSAIERTLADGAGVAAAALPATYHEHEPCAASPA